MSIFTPSQTAQWVTDCLQKADLCQKTNRLEEAEHIFRTVLSLQPDNLPVIINLGALLHKMGRRVEAIGMTGRCLAFDPYYSAALTNLGLMAEEDGELADAEKWYEEAAVGNGVTPQTKWNLSRLLISRGVDDDAAWRRGIEMYEVRWEWDKFRAAQLDLKFPEWRGECSLNGERILIYYEQGYGDTIQHCRFLSSLKTKYPEAHITLLIQKPLVDLMRGLADVVVSHLPNEVFDYQCPLMSLPFALGLRSIREVPTDPPFASIHPYTRGEASKPCVGLCWGGSPANSNNVRRSIPREKLFPLLECNKVYWYSFQKDTDLLTADEVRQHRVWGTSAKLRSFNDTANILTQMDLCITVCTAVAHLAGSLGIPTWLLLSKPGHYLWGQHQETTPWYPSMTIMRQETRGDWDTLISKVKTKLENNLSRFT